MFFWVVVELLTSLFVIQLLDVVQTLTWRGDCWTLAGISTGVIPVEEYLQNKKKKHFSVHNLFTHSLFLETVYSYCQKLQTTLGQEVFYLYHCVSNI